MSTILEKILSERVNVSEKEQDNLVQEVKLLLDSNQNEERQVLQSIGLSQELDYFEGMANQIQIKKKLAKEFDTLIVSTEELSEFCKDYALIVRDTKNYIGKIPTDCGIVLNRFIKKNNIAISHDSHYNRNEFKIVAPPNMFKGYINPFMEAASHFLNFPEKTLNNFKAAIQPDPMLIYKIDEKNWGIIQSWGEDQSIRRRLLGFFYSSGIYSILQNIFWFFSVPIVYFCLLYVFNIGFDLVTPTHVEWGGGTLTSVIHAALNIILIIVGVVLSIVWFFSDSGFFNEMVRNIKDNNWSKRIWV